jgi:YgiT-type zinc finger domain-containing protein
MSPRVPLQGAWRSPIKQDLSFDQEIASLTGEYSLARVPAHSAGNDTVKWINMTASYPHETFIHAKVKYTLEVDGKLIVVENVPARVCVETGEQLFAPETVERLQKLVAGKSRPKRVMKVPVFEFA